MSGTEHPQSSSGPGYEATDAHVPAILKLGLVLVLMIAFSGLASWVIFHLLEAHAKQADPKLSPLAVINNPQPPEPRLLRNEPADLRSVRKEEDAVLETYDWVDKEHGLVRIPIERAMELIAKESAR